MGVGGYVTLESITMGVCVACIYLRSGVLGVCNTSIHWGGTFDPEYISILVYLDSSVVGLCGSRFHYGRCLIWVYLHAGVVGVCYTWVNLGVQNI